MHASSPDRTAEICRLRAQGLTLKEIGALVGLGAARVSQILKAHAEATGELTIVQQQRRRRAELVALARAGASTSELTKRFGLSRSRVSQILCESEVNQQGGFLADPDLCSPRTVEICQLHHNGVSTSELAARFGVTRGAIHNRIRNAKLRSLGLRPNSRSPGLNPIRSSTRPALQPARREAST
jgi:transposase